MENQTYYGNFAEPTEAKKSSRTESVVLSAIEKCQQLESELETACIIIGKMNVKIKELEDFIEMLRSAK